MAEKQHLQSLEFVWVFDGHVYATDFIGYEMTLEGLKPHPNLQELTLLGYEGSRFSRWIPSLITNLVRFTLQGRKKCQALTTIIPVTFS